MLSPTVGQIPTCYSAVRHWIPEGTPCDLHALGTPPAFVLSQDQTLHSVVEPSQPALCTEAHTACRWAATKTLAIIVTIQL